MKPIPDIKTFFYETALYEQFEITKDNIVEAALILFGNQKFDGYCSQCDKESIMHVYGKNYNVVPGMIDKSALFNELKIGLITREAICGRNDHKIIVNIMIKANPSFTEGKLSPGWYFQKIGQLPSIADLTFPQLDRYKSILGKKSREFHKAIGLYTHGIGIGSFVYLRRIFESIIEEAHQQAKQDSQWNEEAYNGCRVDERIEVLKNYLPPFLVKNRKIYGILSKGIHELTEETCLEYFPIVKTGITVILDEKIREKEKEEEIKRAEKEMSEIVAKLKTAN